MDLTALIRADLASMQPYQPICPIEILAARLGCAPDAIVKLDANENPYGPSPRAQAALADLPDAHIYPDPESRLLRAALSDFTGVPTGQLLAGAGADELIDLTMRLFLQPGDAILDCPPTFGMYAFDAAIAGAKVIKVARRPDWSVDVDAVIEAVRRYRPKLLFVTSPNNPDGGWLADADLQRLLDLPLVVVLDEAYVEFAGLERSRIGRVAGCNNLVVLRSFSKWAGLAGLRVGYGAFPAALMPHLWKIKQPYTVSVAASTAAIASLEDRAYLEQTVARIVEERERLWRELGTIPYLRPHPSHANFVLSQVKGRSAGQLKGALEREGLLVRHFDKPRLDDCIRISVGKPEQTDALISVLRRL
jgi:histidinol-phosphate aminotransferase